MLNGHVFVMKKTDCDFGPDLSYVDGYGQPALSRQAVGTISYFTSCFHRNRKIGLFYIQKT